MSWGILGDEKVCTGIRIADKRGDLITVIADCDDDLGSHDFFNGAIADADLIAAAPELLEGMKSIEQRLLSFGINPHAILDTAQACIRQAEGKDAD